VEAWIDRACLTRRIFSLSGGGLAPQLGLRALLGGRTVRRFHRLYYESGARTWGDGSVRWLGVETQKCPLDLWMYQQLLFETRPGVVVETGTHRGGSALFLASVFDLLGNGRVITVDVEAQPGRPAHERITYLSGSSTDPELVAAVADGIPSEARTMVVLDSDHRRDHVAAELGLYAPLVTVGWYLVVEDTNVNGHPVAPDFGPGPWEAVAEFVRDNPGFEVDRDCERFLLTFNPDGYLRRVA
jgi:cephalosporin hydroxylase